MPPLDYHRDDLAFALRSAGKTWTLQVSLADQGWRTERRVSATEFRELLNSDDPLETWLKLAYAFRQVRDWVRFPPPAETHLRRITLDLPLELQALPWEGFSAYWLHERYRLPVIRVSPVIPRYRTRPFSYPLRVLMVDLPPGVHLVPWFDTPEERSRFEGAVDEIAEDAQGLLRRFEAGDLATVDVLHFGNCDRLEQTTERASEPYSLAWFSRVTDVWQVRLLVFECALTQRPAVLRRAAELAERGGPAVLVVSQPAEMRTPYFHHLYGETIHDRPLDVPAPWLFFYDQAESAVACFLGSGREEGVRVSQPVRGLLADSTGREPLFCWLGPGEGLESGTPGLELFSEVLVDTPVDPIERNVFVDQYRDFVRRSAQFAFESHESEGVIPAANAVEPLQLFIAKHQGAVGYSREHAGPRFVNARLWTSGTDGRLRFQPQRPDPELAFLTLGEPCQLSLQIGPQDEVVVTVGARALLEETFKWQPGQEGAWVEFGVTGLDFDVQGHPVQEVFLPRYGVSEPVVFTVTPRRAGASRLRFCLYFQNNVLQSFRFAALVRPGGETATRGDPARHLARALGVPRRVASGLSYLARLEFSRLESVDQIEQEPPRALSIVSNDLGGQPIVTVKGAGLFAVKSAPDAELIRAARNALVALTFDPKTSNYRFAFQNRGTAQNLGADLITLADQGWRLCVTLFGRPTAQKLYDCLRDATDPIAVASVVREKVVPWALVYDRPFDAGASPVSCVAALPDENGNFPVARCGESPNCPLHRTNLVQNPMDEERVACPLHFWGFRHVIEVPPRQVNTAAPPAASTNAPALPALGEAAPRCGGVRVSGTLNLVSAYHSGLTASKVHGDRIATLVTKVFKGSVPVVLTTRNDIQKVSSNSDCHVVYFLCHTLGGVDGDPRGSPARLEFSKNYDPIDYSQFPFAQRWCHGPLVILNGCNTLGFSPDSLSPFLTLFVDDFGASGVLGTDVPVAEMMAAEMVEWFLEAFFEHETAGEALRKARLRLLARKNPLGLVYTLYADSELQLVTGAEDLPASTQVTAARRAADD